MFCLRGRMRFGSFSVAPLLKRNRNVACMWLPKRFNHAEGGKKYFVVVNPNSGARNGENIYALFKNELSQHGLPHEVLVTDSKKQAESFSQSIDPSTALGIVSISGDGTIHEIINGLSKNPHPGALSIPIGILPAGSGNSLANLIGITSPSVGIKKILDKQTKRMDLVKVHHDHTQHISFCVVSWGLHARTVSDSEMFRYFGNRRFIWSAAFNVLFRRHRGELLLEGSKVLLSSSQVNTEEIELFGSKRRIHRVEVVDGQRWGELGSVKVDAVELGYFLISKIQELEKGFRITPFTHIDDGYLDLMVIADTSASKVGLFLKSVFEGNHLALPYVNYLKLKKAHLWPLSSSSPLCVDGELYGTKQGDHITVQTDDLLKIVIYS